MIMDTLKENRDSMRVLNLEENGNSTDRKRKEGEKRVVKSSERGQGIAG